MAPEVTRRHKPDKDILWFLREVLREDVSPAQRVLLQAIYALPREAVVPDDWIGRQSLDALYGLPTLKEAQHPFGLFTQRKTWPRVPFDDVTVICGRRSGKTGRVGLNIALYEAVCGGHERYIAKTERAHVVLMAQSLRTANEAMVLAKAKIAQSPLLQQSLAEERAGELVFKNRMVLSMWPCSFASIRGPHIPVCVMDEVGVWDVEGVNPDREVVRAVRPAMATFPRRLLVKTSTPWAKAGVLWDDWETSWGRDDARTLVWRAPTWYMNPTVGMDYLVQEFDKDPQAAIREYGAEFSDAADAFLEVELIRSAVDNGVHERPPVAGRRYVAAVDLAFKSDHSVLCIAHRESGVVIVDLWRGWAPKVKQPLDPEVLATEHAALCRQYGVDVLMGDQYAAEPYRDLLRTLNMGFAEVTLTRQRFKRTTPDHRKEVGASKVDIYAALKSLFLQGRIRLPDCPEGIKQMRQLIVRRTFQGTEQLGAPSGAHDDYPSALALTVWQALKGLEFTQAEARIVQTGPFLTDQTIVTEGAEDYGPLTTRETETIPLIGLGIDWWRTRR